MKIKNKLGQYFTPQNVVKYMLDDLDYIDYQNINKKYIIDPSCGDGAFLKEIINRYISSAQNNSLDSFEILKDIENFVYGIEIDEDIYNECVFNLKHLISTKLGIDFNLINLKNIKNIDFFNIEILSDIKFNYIVGNPPYFKLKNKNYISKCPRIQNTNSNMYALFIDIGLDMLSLDGKMSMIMPSDFNKSKSIDELRAYIFNNNLLQKYCEISEDVFNASIKTGIYTFNVNHTQNYIEYQRINNFKILTNLKIDNDLFYIKNKFYFTEIKILKIINEILKCSKTYVTVKNGLVTSNDNLFTSNQDLIQTFIYVYVGKKFEGFKKCFYPYDVNGKLLSLSQMTDEKTKIFLKENYEQLSNRPNIKTFYEYGKSQGLKDTYKEKIAFSRIFKDNLSGRYMPSGYHVLGKLYVLNNTNYDIVEILNKEIKNIISNENSINTQYIFIGNKKIKLIDILHPICKRKSNGYYEIEGKTLECLLNYLIDNRFNKEK